MWPSCVVTQTEIYSVRQHYESHRSIRRHEENVSLKFPVITKRLNRSVVPRGFQKNETKELVKLYSSLV